MDEGLLKIEEPVAPQSRLDLARQIESEYEAARRLLKDGLFKEALKKFKWVFADDAGSKVFLHGSEIVKLAKNYPPASAVIKRWRNDKERLIIAEKADARLIRQWDILNCCLGEKDRTTAVFLKLAAADADKRLLHHILNHIWKRLARSKKYDQLKDYLPTLGFHLLLHAVEYDSVILFPTHRKLSKSQRQEEIKRHIEYLSEYGPLSYEVALGLGEQHVANEFAKKILAVETSDLVYASLIKGAVRARAYLEAAALFTEAKLKFSIRQLRHSSKAFKAIPKSQLVRFSA